jgi:hypothetical protein
MMHARMETEVGHGSRPRRKGEPRLAPGHAVRGRVHVAPAGIVDTPKAHAAAAKPGPVATGIGPLTPIALRAQPSRIERSPGTVLPSGWRSLACSLPRRIAEIPAAPITRRGNASKPFRVDPCACKPSGETHRQYLSSAHVLDVRDRDTKGQSCAGTAFL